MNNFIRWYNQNRRKVLFGGLVIIVFLLIFFRLRYINSNNYINISQSDYTQIDTSNYNSISVASDRSATTGNKTSIDKGHIEAIDKFVSFCNSGNIQEAYNLISNECKEQIYNNINDFQEAYYKPVFSNGKRNVSIENWKNNTYVVYLNEDALTTGSYSPENSLQDYITIVKDNDGNTKLNINGYVGRTNYDKVETKDSIEVQLIRKDTYMDYEMFTIKFKNNSGDLALIGRVSDEENVSYLLGKNNLKYNAYVHEFAQSMLELYGYQEKTIQIKYFKEQSSSVEIERLVFPKIYLHYEAYQNFEDKTYYTGLVEISFVL